MTPTDTTAAHAEPLPAPDNSSLGGPADRFAEARLVQLGDAGHGTAQFYRAHAAVTRALIERHGFTVVAVDWPDAAATDRRVRNLPRDRRSNSYLPDPDFNEAQHGRGRADRLDARAQPRPARAGAPRRRRPAARVRHAHRHGRRRVGLGRTGAGGAGALLTAGLDGPAVTTPACPALCSICTGRRCRTRWRRRGWSGSSASPDAPTPNAGAMMPTRCCRSSSTTGCDSTRRAR